MPIENDAGVVVRQALAGFGASGEVLESLVAYTANPFDTARVDVSALPLADGPQLEAWEDYAREVRRDGVLPALARRLVQLRFPVEDGISQRADYLAATRRGVFPEGEGPALAAEDPDGLELVLRPTLVGRVPVITCRARRDFIALVRMLSCRNEPEPVPDSMGACIVNGLNNWDRVARLRRRMEDERGQPFDEGEWGEAFRGVVPQKTLYQDRIVILSRDPYSGVPAATLGIDDAEWRERSTTLRAEHECTHYFTLIAFGVMRNNLLDELIADFAGLAAAFGRYDARLALRFLGLESHPDYRAGGRFENYLKTPPIEPAAASILRDVVVRAAVAVAAFTAGMDLSDPAVRNRIVVALATFTLVELAGDDAVARLHDRLASTPCLTGSDPRSRL